MVNTQLIVLILAVILLVALLSTYMILRLVTTKPRPSPLEGMLLESLKELPALKSQVERLTQEQPRFQDKITSLENAIQGVQTKVVEASNSVEKTVLKDIQGVKSVIEGLKTEYETRRRYDEEVRLATQRIEAVISGSRSRGASGENILVEAFKQLPPGMVEHNFKVKGKSVEFALVLQNNLRLPIDSKWTAFPHLESLAKESDLERRKEIEEAIEAEVLKKVKEVTKYIDPATTTDTAIAAIPDSAYSTCKKAHMEAFNQGVLLMPYSLTLPYVLALYKLHLQYSRSLDIEKLESNLQQVDRKIKEIGEILENSIPKAATMVSNAYNEIRRRMADIQVSLMALHPPPVTKSTLTSLSAGEHLEPSNPLAGEHHLFHK